MIYLSFSLTEEISGRGAVLILSDAIRRASAFEPILLKIPLMPKIREHFFTSAEICAYYRPFILLSGLCLSRLRPLGA